MIRPEPMNLTLTAHTTIVHLLIYAGCRDGKVPGPMLRRLLVWEEVAHV